MLNLGNTCIKKQPFVPHYEELSGKFLGKIEYDTELKVCSLGEPQM